MLAGLGQSTRSILHPEIDQGLRRLYRPYRCSTVYRGAAEAAHRLDFAAVRLDLAIAFGGVPAEQVRQVTRGRREAIERLAGIQAEGRPSQKHVAERNRPLVMDRSRELGHDRRLMRAHALGEPWITFCSIQDGRGEGAVRGPQVVGLLAIESERLSPGPDKVVDVRLQVDEIAAR